MLQNVQNLHVRLSGVHKLLSIYCTVYIPHKIHGKNHYAVTKLVLTLNIIRPVKLAQSVLAQHCKGVT